MTFEKQEKIGEQLTAAERKFQILPNYEQLGEFQNDDEDDGIAVVKDGEKKYLYIGKIKKNIPCINGLTIDHTYRDNKFTLGNEKMVLLALSEIGAKSFDDGYAGQMRFFYIYKIDKCRGNDSAILIGNWLDNVIKHPALLSRECPVEILYTQDPKVNEYQNLSDLERNEVINRLNNLGNKNPEHVEEIIKMIENIRKED